MLTLQLGKEPTADRLSLVYNCLAHHSANGRRQWQISFETYMMCMWDTAEANEAPMVASVTHELAQKQTMIVYLRRPGLIPFGKHTAIVFVAVAINCALLSTCIAAVLLVASPLALCLCTE